MQIELQGELLDLYPERALYWPRTRTLIVADVHLGKGAAFRRAGVAVPSGASGDDLGRLSRLIDRRSAERLLVLGDLFHAQLHPRESWMVDVSRFRDRHSQLCIEVLRGNHDRTPERAPPDWKLLWRNGAHLEAPFVFAHHPQPDTRGYVLAGHLHPVLRLRSATDSLRLPVFWWRAQVGVLPSFGAFTGGHPITREPGDRVHAVTPDAVIEVPATKANRSREKTCATW